jgi:type IV pilus assembly protein PilW
MEREKGFTLLELLIAMGIAIIIMAGIYTTYVSQQKSYKITEQVSSLQQNVRAAMHLMERDIRMAGYDPRRTGDFGFGSIAATTTITFTMDTVTENGARDSGETITYFYDSANKILKRDAGTGAGRQPLAENIQEFTFYYRAESGTTTTDPSAVRAVDITLRAKDGDHERSLTTRVRCRNMGL